jgi:hypothetical protein
MLKKFALLAGMAAMIVACGPSQAEIEAKAKATADSLAAVMRADSIKAAEEAAAQAAAAAAQAAADSAAAAAKAAEEAAAAAKGKKH